ncbi:MAG: ATP-binding protein, partial [Promethearchaeota archaeon]
INPDEKPFIFFDEIQVIPKWEKWVRKIRDLEIAHIFITGSSSKLLSREYGTSLTGRHITQVLFPLSFKEYLRFKNFKIPKNEADIHDKKIWLRKHFQEFLINGGFPEFVLSENIELLKNYFEDILYKDVILRHEIRDVNLLRKIANYCLTNLSQSLSYNSLKNLFKISLDTARSYLSYLEESFMIFQVSIFSYSLKIQEVNPKKVYCIDNGLRNAISFKFSKDEGKLAENLIFIELKRRGKEIYYWKGKNEVDFIVKERDDSLKALNITYTDEITKREIEGLKEFKEKFSSQVVKLIILTKNIEKKKNGIVYIPIWKWLISSEDIV